jgi:hypothetical protein
VRTKALELKSPSLGYAPPEYRMKPWPTEAQIAGWFPALAENNSVHTSSARSIDVAAFKLTVNHCQLWSAPPEAVA